MRCIYFTAVIFATLGAFSQTPPDTLSKQPVDEPAAHSVFSKPKAVRIIVLDFLNASHAPNRASTLLAERIRLNIVHKRGARTVDAGQLKAICRQVGYSSPDSIDFSQIKKIGTLLDADWLITGTISHYHEGDIEHRKNSLELIGKLFNCRTGELILIESVKVSGKKDIDALSKKAAQQLTNKLLK